MFNKFLGTNPWISSLFIEFAEDLNSLLSNGYCLIGTIAFSFAHDQIAQLVGKKFCLANSCLNRMMRVTINPIVDIGIGNPMAKLGCKPGSQRCLAKKILSGQEARNMVCYDDLFSALDSLTLL